MRCLSCDRRLNARESTRKYSSSGTFVDLCDRCFSYVADDIPDTEQGVEHTAEDDLIDTDFDEVDFGEEDGLSTFGSDDDDDYLS